MLLGGQHIAAACIHMRKQYKMNHPNVADIEMPAAYFRARAVVLRVDTPRRALISAAGYHQSTQQDSVLCQMSDVMKMMGRYSSEKLTQCGSGNLNDDELLGCLISMGLERGNKDILKSKQDVAMTEDKARQITEKSVCVPSA